MAYPYQSYQNPWQQGYYPMYQPMQQPIQQQPIQPPVQQTQPMQQSVPQISNVWIYDPSDIPNYPVAPNNAVRFWIANKQVFYEKSADATGKPTLKVYDYTERTETPSESVPATDNKLANYATKDDLAAVVGVVKGFDGLIASMKSDIEKMNGDLYGIAGKKRTVKKPVEVTEDDE